MTGEPPPGPGAAGDPGLVVCARGTGAFRTIGEAVRAARPGQVIRVRPGEYVEGVVLDRPVEIVGDGRPEEIVVEGRAENVLRLATTRAIVRGLTLRDRAGGPDKLAWAVDVRGGQLTLEDCTVWTDGLYGVAVGGADGSPGEAVLRRCRLQGSTESAVFFARHGRGTMEACDLTAFARCGVTIAADPVLVRDCHIHGCPAVGVHCVAGAPVVEDCTLVALGVAGVLLDTGDGAGDDVVVSPVVRNCRIFGCGVGVRVKRGGRGTVEACDVAGSGKAGLHVSHGARPAFRDCRVRDGRAVGVRVAAAGTAGTFERCTVTGNSRTGAAVVQRAEAAFTRCLLRSNGGAGVEVLDQGQGALVDCEVTGNCQAGVVIDGHSSLTARGCRVNRNGGEGVAVREGSAAVTDSDLTGNARGAWGRLLTSRVSSQRNRE